jgi:uncharacterized protein (DUF58 family)
MVDKELLKKIKNIEITSKKLVNEVFSGEYHSVFKGTGVEFSEVREYRPGDDIRFIDWNVTARMQNPFVKIFEEERELNVILMIDASSSLFFSSSKKTKLEIAAEISAIISFSSLNNNDKVGVIIFTDDVELYLPPMRGKKKSLRIIREILSFKPKHTNTKLSAGIEFALKTLKKKSVIFLISDFFDEGFEKPLSILNKKHDLTSIILTDPLEKNIKNFRFINFQDIESGKIIQVDTSSNNFKNNFNSFCQKKFNETKAKLAKLKIDTIDIYTNQSYIEPLIAFFKKRIKLKNR